MYNNLNPKYKSFLFFLIKLAIIVGSLYFIYNKTVHNTTLKFDEFLNQLNPILFKNNLTIPVLLLFTFLNWFFEILKWKTLANQIEKTTFYEAFEQSLSSHTVSLITPNRIGEYGGKALYFPNNKKKTVFLNLIGNSYQLLITTLFGFIGIIFFINTYKIEIEPRRIRLFGYIIGFFILIFITNKNRKLFYFFDIEKVFNYLKSFKLTFHLKLLLFSFFRYLIFSHQFYFLLILFGIHLEYQTAIFLIFTMYLISSSIPTISIFDWAIKGSVAIYVFSFIHASEINIFTISLLMWVLNFAIPSLIGIPYILKFNPSTK